MQTLLDSTQGITPFKGIFRWHQIVFIEPSKRNTRLQCRGIPSWYESW